MTTLPQRHPNKTERIFCLEASDWLHNNRDEESGVDLAERIAKAGMLATVRAYMPRNSWQTRSLTSENELEPNAASLSLAHAFISKNRSKPLRIFGREGIDPTVWMRMNSEDPPLDDRQLAEFCVAAHHGRGRHSHRLSADTLLVILAACSKARESRFNSELERQCVEYAKGRVWPSRSEVSGVTEADAVRRLVVPLEHLRRRSALGPDGTALRDSVFAKLDQARKFGAKASEAAFSPEEINRFQVLNKILDIDDPIAWNKFAPVCGIDSIEKLDMPQRSEDWSFSKSKGSTWTAAAASRGALKCAAAFLDAGANPWSAAGCFDPRRGGGRFCPQTIGPNPLFMGAAACSLALSSDAKKIASKREDCSTFASALFSAIAQGAEQMAPGSGRAEIERLMAACSGDEWNELHPEATALFKSVADEWQISNATAPAARPRKRTGAGASI